MYHIDQIADIFSYIVYSAEGIKPDPAKVNDLKYISPLSNEDDLISFLCMVQLNTDFIGDFSQKATPLLVLTQNQAYFKWTPKQQKCFQQLLQNFRKDTLIRYFYMKKNIYIFTYAHISGLGSILTQENSYQDAKTIVIASQTTS